MWANVGLPSPWGLWWCLFLQRFSQFFNFLSNCPTPPPPTITAQWRARSPIPAGCWGVSAGMMTSNSSSDFALRELDLAFWRHWGNPMIHLGFQCVNQRKPFFSLPDASILHIQLPVIRDLRSTIHSTIQRAMDQKVYGNSKKSRGISWLWLFKSWDMRRCFSSRDDAGIYSLVLAAGCC
ncbi:hypothetical protein I7I51_03396 [Histoplasma capsulatum]|uniref:Uncharacterized protein n=1 Tax=Ajellomyces capsulatus TaxID=5037 RepID=A0A8A1M9C9_AJECA|nr:hypothetical protein I7I51_03396 [Histoplasma capsulatum]